MPKVFARMALLLLLASPALAAQLHTATLTWSYTQNPNRPATSFVVQRGVTTGAQCPMTDLVTALPLTALTYLDATVQGGTTYCYVVLAVDAAGRSLPSNQVGFTIYDLNIVGNLTVSVQ